MQISPEFLRLRQVGLTLSGGAVRGLAHIGVIKALDEVGIKPSVVTGTSVGSIIGAAIAAGRDWREIAEMARAIFWPALLRGKALERFCSDHLPETFGDLKLPFAAVSTIVPANRAIAITSGPLASAISASCALRLLRRPVIREGLRLKDGGFSCVLPTQACRKLGADFLIASDVWEWSSLMRSLGCSPAKPWTSRAYPSQYRFALSFTDIHIHPEIPATSYVPGPSAVDRMIAIGERATHRALEQFSRN
jgi:predicted acylesterase/phospholipase RssA